MTINERVSPKKPLFAEVHNVPDDYRFTTEELDRIISGDMFTPRQDAIMARELQQYRAAAEPVAWMVIDSDSGEKTLRVDRSNIEGAAIPLYAAPQVTSVPQAKNLELAGWQFKSVNGDWLGLIGEHGKNQAVREGCVVREVFAMADGINDREQVRREHAAWSESTFGNVGPVGPLKHLSKEALEAAAEPDDLSEWADMQFLLWDAQRRAGIADEQITQAMVEKLAVNKQREWPEPKDGEPRLHIAAPVVQAEQLSGNTEQVSQPVLPATQFKPVADLYGIAVPGGRSTSYSTDAAEASDCRVMGWDVQEFVKLERLQEAITGNYPAIPDGYALVPVEPTKEMMLHKSGCQRHAWDDADCPMRQTRRLVWSRMIEAVPKQEAQEVKK